MQSLQEFSINRNQSSNKNIFEQEIEDHVHKSLCEQDFKFFIKYFFKNLNKQKFIWMPFHDQICDYLIKVHNGEIRNLIINIPPRCGKTEVVVVMFTAWCFVKNPSCQFIHISALQSLVERNSDAIKRIMRSEKFKEFWPHINILRTADSKSHWRTEQDGVFYAKPSGGGITGYGAGSIGEYNEGKYTFSGSILIDDAIKPKDANYKIIRERVNQYWHDTIKSRRNSEYTPVICIMQRIHPEDFCNELMKDNSENFSILSIPALLNEGTENEESIWPKRYPLQKLKKQKEQNEFVFAAQMQQRPFIIGGNKIKKEWWNFYSKQEEIQKKISYKFVTCDTAYKAGQHNDYSVISLWGAEQGKNLYLLDLIRGKWEFPELLQKSQDCFIKWNKDGRKISEWFVEDAGSGQSLIQTLRQFNIPSKAWNTKKFRYPPDKIGRVDESMWIIKNGVVILPEVNLYLWVRDFINECSEFNNDMTHKHDDQVDTLTMAISIWRYFGGGRK